MKTEKNEFQQLVDQRLSGLQWDARHAGKVWRALESEGGIIVKKKLSMGLVFAMVLVLTASVALAVTSIFFTPEADALVKAHNALKEKYALSDAALGLFSSETQMKKDETVVTFYASTQDEEIAEAIGTYTVTLRKDEAVAVWSHDEIDPLTWQNGALECDVWGAAQLENYLYYESENEKSTYEVAKPTPVPGDTDFTDWFVQAEVEPKEGDMSREEALEAIKAVLLKAYDLTEKDLTDAEAFNLSLYEDSQNGMRTWSADVVFAYQGHSSVYFVNINAATGEVIYCNVLTAQ